MEQKFKSAGKLRLILLLLLFALTAGGCTQLFSDLESAIEAGDSIVFDEDEPSESTVDADPDSIPDYAGTDEIIISRISPNMITKTLQVRTSVRWIPWADAALLWPCWTGV